MTTIEIAELFKAKPIGKGRYQALCPAHSDKNPSLAISSGLDGRVLFKCWAGCSVASILAAAGLSISQLFPSSRPMTGAQLQEFLRKKASREAWNQALVEYSREVFDRERIVEINVRKLGRELASIPDGSPEEAHLVRAFHVALDEFRKAERESDRMMSFRARHVAARRIDGGRQLVAA